MKEIGFGIVGTGSIASRFARACAMVPGVRQEFPREARRMAGNLQRKTALTGCMKIRRRWRSIRGLTSYMSRRRTRFITKTAWRRFEQANRF